MSEWDKEAADRRDYRQGKGAPEASRHRGKRNRKVCKKSPDKVHDFERVETSFEFGDGLSFIFAELKCRHCGRTKFAPSESA